LAINQIMLGNAGVDSKVLASLGTTITVLHGNASGPPSFGAVSLVNDITGNLAVTHLDSGNGASSSSFWRGDGTWATPSTVGTVTHTAGALTVNRLMIGNGSADATILASLGTTTTLLHGNAGGAPSFGAVVTNDLTDNLITNTKLATMTTLTVKANLTAGTAAPTDVTLSALATAMGIVTVIDPNVNAILGWDDIDGAPTTMLLGSGITYNHSTHTLSSPIPEALLQRVAALEVRVAELERLLAHPERVR
jgi:hypothetical protein